MLVKIVVLIKEVPDTSGDRKLSLETGLADRVVSEAVIDEIGERALEVALVYADKHTDVEVTVLSMAPANAAATLRKGLAMGASSAVHVTDEALVGADLGLTAEVLAAAIKHVGYDLVIAGNQSTDGSGAVLPAMIAEWLDVPQISQLTSVEIESDHVTGQRTTDVGTMKVFAPLPAVISVTERMPDARFPNFKGIMGATKKPFETLTLEQLNVEPENPEAARSIVISIGEKPMRRAGVKISDGGDAGAKLAQFLIENQLV
jgi:electron transfer flavoprotein beta subunit